MAVVIIRPQHPTETCPHCTMLQAALTDTRRELDLAKHQLEVVLKLWEKSNTPRGARESRHDTQG